MAEFIALAIGILGVAGVIFTALKYNRDDTTAVLGQQAKILDGMHVLNDELRATTANLRTERDELRDQVAQLSGEVQGLRRELEQWRKNRIGS